ncbi:MAG TPA: HD domain-containing protein, partial [Turneriella sp.]|nr:HD domain-containing protein [Turneriella sp.]
MVLPNATNATTRHYPLAEIWRKNPTRHSHCAAATHGVTERENNRKFKIYMSESYYNYWGKSRPNADGDYDYHPLVYHSLDVAAVGWVWLTKEPGLLAKFGPALGCCDGNELKPLIAFFLGLHDLGKFADSFQGPNSDVRRALGKIGEAPVYNVRHDSLGYL